MQKTIKLEDIIYNVKGILKSEPNITYFYTTNPKNHNEVVFISREKTEEGLVTKKVEEREYPLLMNKFSLK